MRPRVYKNHFSLIVIGTILMGSIGCTSRNLHKGFLPKNPPLERSFVHLTRDGVTLDAGKEAVEFASPAVNGDAIFVANEYEGVTSYDRFGFQKRWQFKTQNGVSSHLLIDSNRLFFGANDGFFYALDADQGRVLWRYETKAPVFAKASIADNRIYISASDDVVHCMSSNDGKWLWHYKRSGNYITTVHGNSGVTVDDGVAYVGFSDGYLVALGAKDGNLKWELKIHTGSKFTDIDATPVVDGNTIFVPSYDGELYSVDRRTGKPNWHIEVGGSRKVLLEEKDLFAASSQGAIFRINKESGRIQWKFELDDGTPTDLVSHSNYLAFGGSRHYFYAIHKGDGTLAWRENIGLRSGFSGSPVSNGKEIYALSNFGNLYVYKWLK